MTKEDNGSGLLSKMVRFVRSPGAVVPDSQIASVSKEDALNKQLLKDMMERKRQNDFVRKREFDMLRKLRKRELMPNAGGEPTGRPSFFQSSLMSRPDERATTLKKIDEIEAQMSMQWWKNKAGSNPDMSSADAQNLNSSSFGLETKSPPSARFAEKSEYRSTVPIGLQSASGIGLQGQPLERHEMPTEPDLLRPQLAATQSFKPPVVAVPAKEPLTFVPTPSIQQPSKPNNGHSSSLGESKMNTVQVEEFVAHDAELEEAAIRFANSDESGAEAGILELLAPGATRERHIETWLCLFDFYRATGQSDKFDMAALQFAEYFGRSAPQWFSMPEIIKQLTTPNAIKASGNGPNVDWICPSSIGLQTIAVLRTALGRAAMPWRIDWSNLKAIEDAAIAPLLQVFTGWAAQPVQLRFIQAGHLQKILQTCTPVGDTSVAQSRWQLRLQTLRVMHQADEFELVALDFCMTYELSPPAWSAPVCECKMLASRGDADPESLVVVGQAYRDSALSTIHSTEFDSRLDAHSSLITTHMSVELSGQIFGDASQLLDEIEAKLAGADALMISCAKLIRVDFSAAGALLNWVAARQLENRTVQFTEVHRLVAAFFNVMGIAEQAKVSLRKD